MINSTYDDKLVIVMINRHYVGKQSWLSHHLPPVWKYSRTSTAYSRYYHLASDVIPRHCLPILGWSSRRWNGYQTMGWSCTGSYRWGCTAWGTFSRRLIFWRYLYLSRILGHHWISVWLLLTFFITSLHLGIFSEYFFSRRQLWLIFEYTWSKQTPNSIEYSFSFTDKSPKSIAKSRIFVAFVVNQSWLIPKTQTGMPNTKLFFKAHIPIVDCVHHTAHWNAAVAAWRYATTINALCGMLGDVSGFARLAVVSIHRCLPPTGCSKNWPSASRRQHRN